MNRYRSFLGMAFWIVTLAASFSVQAKADCPEPWAIPKGDACPSRSDSKNLQFAKDNCIVRDPRWYRHNLDQATQAQVILKDMKETKADRASLSQKMDILRAKLRDATDQYSQINLLEDKLQKVLSGEALACQNNSKENFQDCFTGRYFKDLAEFVTKMKNEMQVKLARLRNCDLPVQIAVAKKQIASLTNSITAQKNKIDDLMKRRSSSCPTAPSAPTAATTTQGVNTIVDALKTVPPAPRINDETP